MQRQHFRGKWKNQDVIFVVDINKGFLISSQNDMVTISYFV